MEQEGTDRLHLCSNLTFLKKIIEDETEDMEGEIGDFGLLVIAVHAAFLDSGFLALSKRGNATDRLPTGWDPDMNLVIPVSYTTIALYSVCNEDGCDLIDDPIEVAFSQTGNFVSVYGYFSKFLDIYRETFYLPSFIPSLRSAMTLAELEDDDEARVFDLWKTVKDVFCLPLLVDVSKKYHLSPPPCFTNLPTDMKIRILEFLRGDDLARIGCVDVEMNRLSSNDELWKKKFDEEFGISSKKGTLRKQRWKDSFVMFWNISKYGYITSRSYGSGGDGLNGYLRDCVIPPFFWRSNIAYGRSRFSDQFPFFNEIDQWSEELMHPIPWM